MSKGYSYSTWKGQKQWKCPDCGSHKLNRLPYINVDKYACGDTGCVDTFSKKTIQALMGPWTNIPSYAKGPTFTTSPPGFQMPWENQVLVNQEDYDTYAKLLSTPTKCDCGGEKTGGTHSTWCSKGAK